MSSLAHLWHRPLIMCTWRHVLCGLAFTRVGSTDDEKFACAAGFTNTHAEGKKHYEECPKTRACGVTRRIRPARTKRKVSARRPRRVSPRRLARPPQPKPLWMRCGTSYTDPQSYSWERKWGPYA